MRFVVLAVFALVTLAAVRSAEACPCCGPCNKYKMDRLERAEPVDVYVRVKPAAMPRPSKRGKVMALLTGSNWRARKPAHPRALATLRIYDGANVPDTVPDDGASTQIIHDLILESGHFEIDLGGGRYQISPCRDRGRVTSCLVRLR